MMRINNVKAVVAAAAFAVIAFVYTNLAQAPAPPAAPPQQQQAPAGPVPAVLRNYQPVTGERLKNPEEDNWLMVRRTYDGWGYSPLKQITPAQRGAAAAGLGVLDRRDAAATKRRRS